MATFIHSTELAITENDLINRIFNTLKTVEDASFEGSCDEDSRYRFYNSPEGSLKACEYKEYGKDTYHYKIYYSSIKAPEDKYIICDNYYSTPSDWTIDYHRFTSIAFTSPNKEKVEAFNLLKDDPGLLENTTEKLCDKINKIFEDSKFYEEEEAKKSLIKKKEVLSSILGSI